MHGGAIACRHHPWLFGSVLGWNSTPHLNFSVELFEACCALSEGDTAHLELFLKCGDFANCSGRVRGYAQYVVGGCGLE